MGGHSTDTQPCCIERSALALSGPCKRGGHSHACRAVLSSIGPTTHPVGLVPPGPPQLPVPASLMTQGLVFRVHCPQRDSTKSGHKATVKMTLPLVHNITDDSADELLWQRLTLLAHSPSLPAQTTAEDQFWTTDPSLRARSPADTPVAVCGTTWNTRCSGYTPILSLQPCTANVDEPGKPVAWASTQEQRRRPTGERQALHDRVQAGAARQRAAPGGEGHVLRPAWYAGGGHHHEADASVGQSTSPASMWLSSSIV